MCPYMMCWFTRQVNSDRSLRAEMPFWLFTRAETGTFDGYSTSRCTWSSSPLNSRSSAPKSPQTFRMASWRHWSRSASGTPRRYFVTKTKWT